MGQWINVVLTWKINGKSTVPIFPYRDIICFESWKTNFIELKINGAHSHLNLLTAGNCVVRLSCGQIGPWIPIFENSLIELTSFIQIICYDWTKDWFSYSNLLIVIFENPTIGWNLGCFIFARSIVAQCPPLFIVIYNSFFINYVVLKDTFCNICAGNDLFFMIRWAKSSDFQKIRWKR